MATCQCMTLAESMKLTLGGHEMPRCEIHDGPAPGAGTPLALNDDDALTAAISRAVGVPVNRTTSL
ncbi:hypothetical protein [Trujillonella endophytica]|uniref:Uncharacterized protein n=1 Tax=Trujillonella endophytica TaxID=673521 RepID=A0A1H8UI01_9ACTN|nr:hypothetical protein [Trujillella endophytica]SEP02849.1 hypothetical protein SAMN05660991_02936 [Trujillella endophytica]